MNFNILLPKLIQLKLLNLTLPNQTKLPKLPGASTGSLALQGTLFARCQIQKLPNFPKDQDGTANRNKYPLYSTTSCNFDKIVNI